jgi:quercetin dioxygenase-like cupin family protein
MKPSDDHFVRGSDIEAEKIKSVEGMKEEGLLTIKTLLVGENTVILEIFRRKGLIDPLHKHEDHESACYLIKGKLKLVIGEKEFIAGPGSAWIHPINVGHFSETLEDCLQIEIKSPPRKTWVS